METDKSHRWAADGGNHLEYLVILVCAALALVWVIGLDGASPAFSDLLAPLEASETASGR